MRGGRLRCPVTIEALDSTRNEYGEVVVTDSQKWQPVETGRWARIEPLSGNEASHAEQIIAEVTHSITMRMPLTLIGGDRIGPQHRIRYGDRVFDIVSLLNEDERGRMATIGAREVPRGS